VSSVVTSEQHGRVRVLALDRPAKRNTLSAEVWAALTAALEAAADDPQTSVVVLRGEGKGFCAGVELDNSYVDGGSLWADRERMRRTYAHLDAVFDCPLPVVAAVHGFALGGGADLALHCDFLVAADDALIGHPAVRNVGVAPTNMWFYRLGPQLAKRLLLTGDRITGAEAARLGLALFSCPADELFAAAMDLAQRIAMVDRACLMGNKVVINRGLDLMGRRALNAAAQVEDAIAHQLAAGEFMAQVAAVGVREAVEARDAPFGADPVRISGVGVPTGGGSPVGGAAGEPDRLTT
jgi:enoyl-CoA hydratase